MDSDNHYAISNRNWNPRFKDVAMEHEFRLDFNANTLNSGRIGVWLTLLIWTGFSLFDLQLNGDAAFRALLFRLLIIAPIVLGVLALLYSRRAAEMYQTICCFTILVIQSSIYYVVRFYDFETVSLSFGYDLPLSNADGKCIFIFAWLMIIFMASSTIGLNIPQSVMSGLVFISLNLLSIFTYQPSVILVIIFIPFSIVTLSIVWIASIHIQRYARERFRAVKLLSKYLPPQVTDTISGGQINLIWKHSRRRLTLFFSDIKDFTTITDSMEPEDMAAVLNEYLTEMNRIINKYNGTLAQVIGDGLYVFFGAPIESSDKANAVRCVRMAIEMQLAAKNLSLKWFNKGVDEVLKLRCGVNTGMVTVGGYGSSDRKEYTAMGMQVNIAARLEQACEPGQILISHATWALVRDEVASSEKGQINVKGYHKPVRIYEVTPNEKLLA